MFIQTEIFGGTLTSDIYQENNRIYITPNLQDINAALLPLDVPASEVNLLGMLELDGSLNFPINRFMKSTGSLSLRGKSLKLDESRIAIKTLPPMSFDTAILSLDFGKGKATVREGLISSKELTITIGGHIKLKNAPLQSRLYLTLKIETGEEIDKLIGTLGKPYQDADGTYNFKILGRLNAPRFQSQTQKAPKRKTPRKTKPARDTIDEEIDERRDASNSRIGDDDKEKRRQERIEKARQRRAERLKNREINDKGIKRVLPNLNLRPRTDKNDDGSDNENDEDDDNDESDNTEEDVNDDNDESSDDGEE